MPPGWTAAEKKAQAGLERELRGRWRVARPQIVVASVRGHGGYVTYEGDGTREVVIVWDPMQYDLLDLVIHEMTHLPMAEPLRSIGKLEEGGVEGIASRHIEYVRESPARYRWWTRAIRSRLTVESFRRWLNEQEAV